MKIEELAQNVIERLKLDQKTVASAESCTGGGIGHYLTSVSGSSAVYTGGVISYTNEVKAHILGVPEEVLEEKGAVSAETAAAMAEGVRRLMNTDFGISVTGLAGPDGDGSGKPVGLVYIGLCSGRTTVHEFVFSGNREEVRNQAIASALEILLHA